jgi:hypothetical protein
MARKGVKDVKVFLEYDLIDAMDIMALKLRQDTHFGKIGVGNIAESMILWAAQHNPEFKEAIALVRQWAQGKTETHLSPTRPASLDDVPTRGEGDTPG